MSASAVQWVVENSRARGDDFAVLVLTAAELPHEQGAHVDWEKIAHLSDVGADCPDILRRLGQMGELACTDMHGLFWLPSLISAEAEARMTRIKKRALVLWKIHDLDYSAECHYCGGDLDLVGGPNGAPAEIEHVLPRSRGGADDYSNYTLSCRPCNRSKAAKTPYEWKGSPCCTRHTPPQVVA